MLLGAKVYMIPTFPSVSSKEGPLLCHSAPRIWGLDLINGERKELEGVTTEGREPSQRKNLKSGSGGRTRIGRRKEKT